jgi:hypothetical protein
VRRNPQHKSLPTVASAASAPPLQPLHQPNVCHPVLNRFTRQTLPTVNRKHFFMNVLWLESFCPKIRTTERCSSVVQSSSTVAILTTELSLWTCACASVTLGCHEAGLCCYLMIHIENLLHPLQLFYFHLWPVYWLSIVTGEYKIVELAVMQFWPHVVAQAAVVFAAGVLSDVIWNANCVASLYVLQVVYWCWCNCEQFFLLYIPCRWMLLYFLCVRMLYFKRWM